MAAPGTAEKALAGAVGPAPLGDPHPLHRWPARSCMYHPDQEIALCPPGDPGPTAAPFPNEPPTRHPELTPGFSRGKAAAFLGKSPQDAGETHRAAWKRPRFHHASLEHVFLKSWSWEQGSSTHIPGILSESWSILCSSPSRCSKPTASTFTGASSVADRVVYVLITRIPRPIHRMICTTRQSFG